MAGSLPASGAITFDMLNTYAGLASGSQIALGGALARLYAGKLTTNSAISMSDMYSQGVDFALSLASSIGNGVSTPNLLLSSYFDAGQLPAGSNFYVTALCTDAYWPPDNVNPTVTFVKGSPGQFTYSKSYRKSYNMQVNYDGADTVYGYGFYSGDSTSFPNGKVTLTAVRIIL